MNKTSSITVLALSLSLVALTGCSRASHKADVGASTAAGEPPAREAAGSPAQNDAVPALKAGAPLAGRSLVVTMDLSLTVEDVDAASTTIRGAVDRAGGYVANVSDYGRDDDRRAQLELRVPADRVETVRESLAKVGEVTSDTEKTEDVTEQRADLDARLANARVEEKRVLEIMQSRAGSIGEVIEAEKELSRTRETIERLEAEQRTLEHKIDLATIHVTLERRAVPAYEHPGPSIAHAGRTGVHAAATFYTWGAIAFVTVAPVLVPIAALLTILGLVLRRRSARRLAALTG